MSKEYNKRQLNRLLIMAPLLDELSGEYHELALSLTRHMGIVYSEINNPRFMVMELSGNYSRRKNRTLHIFHENKWVPLTKSKIFAARRKLSHDTKKSRVLSALRECIKPQVEECRTLTPVPFVCPLTRVTKTSKEGCHVDHYHYPFIQIVEMWMNLRQLNYELIPLSKGGSLKSSEHAIDFYQFHKQQAVLRLVDGKANVKKGAIWVRH